MTLFLSVLVGAFVLIVLLALVWAGSEMQELENDPAGDNLPVPTDTGSSLSEMFPELPEQDLIWMQQHGGYAEYDLYPEVIPASPAWETPALYDKLYNKLSFMGRVREGVHQDQIIRAQQKLIEAQTQALEERIRANKNKNGR